MALSLLLTAAICWLTARAAEEIKPAGDALDKVVETVEFHDTPIADVLRLLARQNDLNLIIGPDSMGNVSLRFSGVTLRAALDAILRSKGYQYQLYDNIMLVNSPDSLERIRGLGLETRLFRLKYSDARDIKATIDTARVLSPWGNISIFSQAVMSEAVKAGALAPRTNQDGATAATNVAQGGTKPLQTRSDVLLVTDRRKNLELVASLIDDLDKLVRRVAIDVKFVETILSDEQTTGINWQQVLSVQGAYQGKSQWELGGSAGAGTVQFGALSTTNFDVLLDMLLKNQRAKLLSQPRIATLDHQPATIAVGVTTWIEERTSDPATGIVQITYSERLIPIELVVVPHIIEGDRVMLEMRPVVEEITGWQEGAQGQQLPIISSRTADSRIEVRNNETAVIGGLLKDKTLSTIKKVWLLGSLPLLGHLFRHRAESVERTDLSIFITPHIIRDDETSPFPLPKDDADANADGESASALASASSAAKPAAKPEAPAGGEVIDLNPYFPLAMGAKWSYDWQDSSGGKWQSNMVVQRLDGGVAYALETIPEGAYRSQAHTGYRWDKAGLTNLFKTTPGRDSVAYAPTRVILPAQMEVGKRYENGYGWTLFGIRGQKSGLGSVRQQQRLLRREAVTLPTGRLKDCLVVETIWFDAAAKTGVRKRKLVWYARDVGPVKVEHDLPLDEGKVKGRMSALLGKR